MYWDFAWNFMWRKRRQLCWWCFHTTSNGMHYKPDPSVRRSQPQKRNKYLCNHFLMLLPHHEFQEKQALFKEYLSQDSTPVRTFLRPLCGFHPQPGPGCPWRPPTDLPLGPHFPLIQVFLVLFVPQPLLQTGEVSGSLFRIIVFNM